MAIVVDHQYPGDTITPDTSTVAAVNTAGNVAMTLTKLPKDVVPTLNLPVYFTLNKVDSKTWQVKYTGVAIPKTATTLIVTAGTQTYKMPLFVT